MIRDVGLGLTEGLSGTLDPLEIPQLDPPTGPAFLTQEGDDVEVANGDGARATTVRTGLQTPPAALDVEVWTSVHVPRVDATRIDDKGHPARCGRDMPLIELACGPNAGMMFLDDCS